MNQGSKEAAVHSTKKPFDKKKWREKKYSHQFKFQQWEEKRRKVVLRKYYKELKKENITSVPNNTKDNSPNNNPKFKSRLSSFEAAQRKLKQLREEKQKQIQERLRKKEEMKQALEQYKKTRADNFKKNSKKTKKGQPLMRGRIEMLYEKIKDECAS